MTVKKDGDFALLRDSLYGITNEPTYAGALSFMRRKYTKDMTGVDLAVTRGVDRTDGDDLVAVDRHVGGGGARAGAVDDRAAANDEIMGHGKPLCLWEEA